MRRNPGCGKIQHVWPMQRRKLVFRGKRFGFDSSIRGFESFDL